MKRIPKENQLSAAVDRLESLIADGWEFPDACWKVACGCNAVSYEEIQAEYDERTYK